MTVERDALLGAIRSVKEVVSHKSSVPILANLLIDANADTAFIRGTDLDIQMEVEVPCECAELATTVSAELLLAAVDTLRGGKITLTLADSKLKIVQGRATRTLATLPVTEFPLVNPDEFAATFEMPASGLLRMIDATHVAMSSNPAQYVLNGVYVHTADDLLVAVALDMNRLVRATEKLPHGAEQMPSIILAAKSVALLRTILRNCDDGAATLVQVNAKQIAVRVGRTRVVCKLVEGTYPDYTKAIPLGNDRILKVQATEFARSVHAASVLSDVANGSSVARGRGVKIKLDADSIEAIGRSLDGSVIEPIDGEWEAGLLEFGLNSGLAIPLANIFGEAAKMDVAFRDARDPILFTSPDKPALTAVVLPMRI